MSGWEQGWGLDFLVFMNNLGGKPLDLFFEPFNILGGELGYTILMPLVFWSIHDGLGRRLYALAMSNALVNGLLKSWWMRPRPFQVAPDRIVPAHTESSYGLPSGHTQGGTVMGLFFAGESSKKWFKALMYVLIFLMGISRMIHGVHFLQDVLVGWLLGFAVFFAFSWFEKRGMATLRSMPLWSRILLSLIPALLVFAAEYLLQGSYPATKSLHASGGALSGIFLGMILEQTSGYFRSSGKIWERILRVPVGIAAILLTQVVLSKTYHAVFQSPDPGVLGIASYIIRFVITGFIGFWLIPQLFIICRLARKRETA